MNGSHRSPISTGITPTYVPITAKKAAISPEGLRAGAADSTSRSKRVPSSVVMPIVYGSATFQSNGMRTTAVSYLSRCASGSTAAGCILSLTSATAMETGMGPVLRTVAIISEPAKSTRSMVTSGSGTPTSSIVEPGPDT